MTNRLAWVLCVGLTAACGSAGYAKRRSAAVDAPVAPPHCLRLLGAHPALAFAVLREEGAPSFVRGARARNRYHVVPATDEPVVTLSEQECREAGICGEALVQAEELHLGATSPGELLSIEVPGLGKRQSGVQRRESALGGEEWTWTLEHLEGDPWVLGRVPQSFDLQRVDWYRAGDRLFLQLSASTGGVQCLVQRADLGETGASMLGDEAVTDLREGRVDQAIETLTRAVELAPTDATVQYNLACGYALKGELDAALFWLDRAFEFDEHGRLRTLATKDKDLEALWTRDEFLMLLAKPK